MSTKIPRKAIELLQDVTHGETDETLEDLLNSVLRVVREEQRPKGRSSDVPSSADRARVLGLIRKRLAMGDPAIVLARQFDERHRRQLLASIISEARNALVSLASEKGSHSLEIALVLPGILFGVKNQDIKIGLSAFENSEPGIREIIRWSAREAMRISKKYFVHEALAVIFLYLDDFFLPKPLVGWHLEMNRDDETSARIFLEVDPFVSPDEVKLVYTMAREELELSRGRTQRARTYALAEFFLSHTHERSDWRRLMEDWNSHCDVVLRKPKWMYLKKAPTSPRDRDRDRAYQFQRDTRYALESLAGEKAARSILGD